MNVGLIINKEKVGALAAAEQIVAQVCAAASGVYCCGESSGIEHLPALAPEPFFNRVDAVISLGGDGTMLHAVQLMGGMDVPIIGINLGNLGFMTSVSQDSIGDAVEMLLNGKYDVSERSRIAVTVVERGEPKSTCFALNDVAIGWGASSRIISLGMSINGEYVTGYTCDGLIISTPTGSTGHSLSAGGPILHPDADVFVVSPVCPHTLSSRPLVVDHNACVSVEILETSKDLLLAVDGQEHCCVAAGDMLEFKKCESTVKFIHFPGYSYYNVLRQKLRWRGSSV